jgi:hypothetical protein
VIAGPLAVAFDRIFDDAAIFPPGNMPMHGAVAQHAAYRCGDRAPFVGPFVCSMARLPELAAALDCLEQRLDVSVVVPAGGGEPATSDRMNVVSVERPLGAQVPGIAPDYVELATLPGGPDDLAPLAGARAKFRTGGLTADAYPSEAELAAAIRAAVEAGVPFKCTAGLHHAVRHTGEDGCEHHGFLNLLLATHAALQGGDVAAVLAERDGGLLAAALRALPEDEIVRTRRAFCSFGTCSVDEPIADLVELGLLP